MPSIPSDQSCMTANLELFKLFSKLYIKQTKSVATSIWSEAEVVQWLDLELEDKYLHDTLDTNSR